MTRRSSQSRTRQRPKQHVLELRVRSPRIMLFGVLKGLGRVVRVVLMVVAAGAAVWGAGLGLKWLFVDNEEFRLQAIELTPNGVIDELGVVALGEIDLRASVFEVGTVELERRLEERADIVSARVDRQLPGTLRVEVVAREPVAWLECVGRGLLGRDREAGVLMDRDGVLFGCSETLWAEARELPVVEVVEVGEDPLVLGERVLDAAVRRALGLVLVVSGELGDDGGWRAEAVRVVNPWSLELLTSDGERAVFGLSDTRRQMADFLVLKEHVALRGGRIGSVNLIPERNIPVLLGEAGIPRAVVVGEAEVPELGAEPAEAEESEVVAGEFGETEAAGSNRLDRDVRAILNRN